MTVSVNGKGQVTIPKPIRDHLGIGPGSRVDFRLAANGGVMQTVAFASYNRREFMRSMSSSVMFTFGMWT